MSTARASMRAGTRLGAALALVAVAMSIGCESPPPDPLPPGSFAFGVVGDAPYHPSERGPWRRVIADVRRADVEWLIHVGDLFWHPCSDAAYAKRRHELESIGHPVVYTPGDNDWTDCWQNRPGRYDPLERLSSLRRVFFPVAGRSLGSPPLALESQSADSAFSEFRENARWTRGGFVFATVHIVGSGNGRAPFAQRTAANDAEVERRTAAAVAWLDAAFDRARAEGAKGVVLAMHAEMGLEQARGSRGGYDRFVARLEQHLVSFPGTVLLIHGDSHIQRVDHPLKDAKGRVYPNFTRLETFGSPEVGWVRVVVDTAAGRITRYEPRRMAGWW